MVKSLNETRTEKTKRLKTIPRSRLEEVLRQTLSEVKDRKRELPLEFNLQCLPLSTNMMSGRSKTYETKEFLEYRNLVAQVAGGTYGITKEMQFRAYVVVGYSNKRADADNSLKPLFDAITACVDDAFDDSQIYEIHVIKKVVSKGNEYITLSLDVLTEEWRPIPEFPTYEVSNEGNVRNTLTGRQCNLSVNAAGYLHVKIFNEGAWLTKRAHRLVASAFLKKPKGKDVVNHKDEDRGNNTVGNLEWTTQKENIEYSAECRYTLISPKGTRHQTTNLDDFCREHELDPSGIRRLFRGERKTHKGWKVSHKESI